MAKLNRRTNALLAILFVLVGVGRMELNAAGANEWYEASESSATPTTDAINPADGKLLIDGVILGSAAASQAYVEFRDSNTANVLRDIVNTPKAVVFFGTNTVVGALPVGTVVMFPRPLRFLNGLSANASNCNTNAMCFSVLFRRVQD